MSHTAVCYRPPGDTAVTAPPGVGRGSGSEQHRRDFPKDLGEDLGWAILREISKKYVH